MCSVQNIHGKKRSKDIFNTQAVHEDMFGATKSLEEINAKITPVIFVS